MYEEPALYTNIDNSKRQTALADTDLYHRVILRGPHIPIYTKRLGMQQELLWVKSSKIPPNTLERGDFFVMMNSLHAHTWGICTQALHPCPPRSNTLPLPPNAPPRTPIRQNQPPPRPPHPNLNNRLPHAPIPRFRTSPTHQIIRFPH